MRPIPIVLALATLLVAGRASADEYLVGSGAYPTLASVPWSSLGPGDVVTIPHRATPYRETFAITTSGTADRPIVVRGTRGPGGERPVLDGDQAVQGAGTHVRSLVSLRNGAQHVVIEGLELVNAHHDYAHDGLFPGANASGIYVEDASHVVVRDCSIHGNGNGIFSAPGTADVRIERNHVHGNGNDGSTQEHNSYTESDGIVFEGNRYGPLCDGCLGNNLKDRSVGTIVRYNLIEGGNRPLDLVEAETDDDEYNERTAATPVYVYGNVLVKRDDTSQSQVVHFGGDNGTTSLYRRRLYFYNNTIYSTRAARTTFFHFDADEPVIDVRNCVYLVPTSAQILLVDSSTEPATELHLDHVYLPPDWDVSVDSALASIVTSNAVTTGTDPGFVDAAALDFHLEADAALRNAGTTLVAGAPNVVREYADLDTVARFVDGPLDIGAYERCDGSCMVAMETDGGVGPGTDGGPTGPGSSGDGCGCSTAGRTGPAANAGLVGLLALLAARRRFRGGARLG